MFLNYTLITKKLECIIISLNKRDETTEHLRILIKMNNKNH